MNLKEKIDILLDQIAHVNGVENAVLTQRDGYPIQSTGVWLSKDEIFDVCSATSAIFNAAIRLHPNDLKYVLIEADRANILIAPLNNPLHRSLEAILKQQGILDDRHEFFIAITARPNINLGGIYLQASKCLKKIKMSLITSGESFKPPQKEYNQKRINQILKGFKVKEEEGFDLNLSTCFLSLTKTLAMDIRKVLEDFSLTIPELKYAFISSEGGSIIDRILIKTNIDDYILDNVSATDFSLFHIADKSAWLLKKTHANRVLIDCDNYFQFLYRTKKAIFNTKIGKRGQRLAYLRLILPQFKTRINEILSKINYSEPNNLTGTFKIVC